MYTVRNGGACPAVQITLRNRMVLGWVWLDMGKNDAEAEEMRKAQTGYEVGGKIHFFGNVSRRRCFNRLCIASRLLDIYTRRSVPVRLVPIQISV